jgi:hypothetical protein
MFESLETRRLLSADDAGLEIDSSEAKLSIDYPHGAVDDGLTRVALIGWCWLGEEEPAEEPPVEEEPVEEETDGDGGSIVLEYLLPAPEGDVTLGSLPQEYVDEIYETFGKDFAWVWGMTDDGQVLVTVWDPREDTSGEQPIGEEPTEEDPEGELPSEEDPDILICGNTIDWNCIQIIRTCGTIVPDEEYEILVLEETAAAPTEGTDSEQDPDQAQTPPPPAQADAYFFDTDDADADSEELLGDDAQELVEA